MASLSTTVASSSTTVASTSDSCREPFRQLSRALPTVVAGLPTVVASLPTVVASLPTVVANLPTVVASLPTVVASLPTVVANLPTAVASLATVVVEPFFIQLTARTRQRIRVFPYSRISENPYFGGFRTRRRSSGRDWNGIRMSGSGRGRETSPAQVPGAIRPRSCWSDRLAG